MMKQTFFFLSSFLLCSATTNNHSGKLGKYAGAGYEDYFDNSGSCFLKGTCQPLQNATCFGTSLPYTHFSDDLVKDSRSLFEVQDNFTLWQGLRSVPHCWAVIQPLLCAVYMPKCENDSIYLPSQEMCRVTRGPCKRVAVEQGWLSFLQCDNKTLFPPRCRNPLQGIKFNTSSKCVSPLVETDNPDNWFHDVAGCGIQCQNPLYTATDHTIAHCIIFITASLCLLSSAQTVVFTIIKWKELSYQKEVNLYINLCWAMASLGWIVQFFPGAREKIACMDDGTVRRLQPEFGPSLCSITFILIYFFSMAAVVWFVILTYVWYSGFPKRGSKKDSIQRRKAYFDIWAWCIPFFLTELVRKTTELDGDSLSGICFIGFSNINERLVFVYVPVCIAFLLGGYFLALFLVNIVKKILNCEVVTSKQSKKFCLILLNRGFIALCLVLLFHITFYCLALDFTNRKEWDKSFKDYVKCLAMNSGQSSLSGGETSYSECVLKSKPHTSLFPINLLCLLFFSVVISLSSLNPKKSSLFFGSSYLGAERRHNIVL